MYQVLFYFYIFWLQVSFPYLLHSYPLCSQFLNPLLHCFMLVHPFVCSCIQWMK
jgi:hypothetical protein